MYTPAYPSFDIYYLKYVYKQWNNGVLFSPFYSNKSHDIMAPLVWASTVSSYTEVKVTENVVKRRYAALRATLLCDASGRRVAPF